LVRRIAPSDRAAMIRVESNTPRHAPQGVRGAVWSMIRERKLDAGEKIEFQPEAWAEELGVSREQLHAALGGLHERGYLYYRAAARNGGVELLAPEKPLQLDEKKIRERRSREFSKLDRMDAYAHCKCRRRYIVEYFGEKFPLEKCGTCDQCREGRAAMDEERLLSPEQETVVLKLLSCVARMERHTQKKGFSVDLIAKTVLGSREEKVSKFGFDSLPTWGILGPKQESDGRKVTTWTQGEIADIVQALSAARCLDEAYVTRGIGGKDQTYKEYGVSVRGWRVLKREERDFRMVFPSFRKLERAKIAPQAAGVSGELLSLLRDVRARLAEKHGVPAYVVAPNKTLEEMARLRPNTRRAMLAVHGMGEQRYARYGAPFLETIQKWSVR